MAQTIIAAANVVPSMECVTAPCPKCATSMVLAFIVPHPMNTRMEKYTYLCAKCNQTRSYALPAKNSTDPKHSHQIDEVRASDDEKDACKFTARRDFRIAELVIDPLFKKGWLNQSVVKEFAEAKRIDEVLFAITRLAGMPTGAIERLIMRFWSSPVGTLLKEINFNLATIDAIYCARPSNGGLLADDLKETKLEFMKLTRPAAERIMRFYKTQQLSTRQGDV
ncbi:MAG: DUF2336 domain-containing protein [Pseudolabrys sp.]|nr:DUF2336 domain-containing protein [Pseudolabrys sp.]